MLSLLRTDVTTKTLATLLKAELAAGILGLRLFMACVGVATFMLGAVWMLGGGLTDALSSGGLRMLGGDVAVSVPNTPLDDALTADLARQGRLSRVVEMRTSATVGAGRGPVELKGVDEAYPLYGQLTLSIPTGPAPSLHQALAERNGLPGAVVEPTFLARFDARVGDTIRLGERRFEIRALLVTEPDRLSAGGFLVGPRVIVQADHLQDTGLLARGALAEYRYRLRFPANADPAQARERVAALKPARGWEFQSPADAGDRVRRTVERTTTFLGVAGIVALAIGLAGAWAAAAAWVSRRGRTIALYRLSGATPPLVIALHAVILGVASALGLILGLMGAAGVSVTMMEVVATQLHLIWQPTQFVFPALEVTLTMTLGLVGASTAALSAAARTAPGAAMRSGETSFAPSARHVAWGGAAIALAMAVAVLSLPVPWLAMLAAIGLSVAAGALGLGGFVLARYAAGRRPKGFITLVASQGLAIPGAAATKALAIGIGIAGITAIVAAQNSLERALLAELPEKIPDLVLIDVQPDQVQGLRTRIQQSPDLGGLQATPNMRTTILAVNGVPATEALVNPDKSWTIEGDRSFSWSAEPTGAELLSGTWWAEDYDGPPLASAEEDLMEAFNLVPGDEITYSVLGRTFTSKVVNVRKEYHRNFRPDFLLMASPNPFKDAPHSWVMTLLGDDRAVDDLINTLNADYPNVTAIDVRRLVAQVTEVIDGAVLGSLAVAVTLLLAGGLSLAAVVAADVDSREREALAYTLIGASRGEIALARLAEALVIGILAAVLGGLAGLGGGLWLVNEALRVSWAPGLTALILPLALGALAAMAAGVAGGLGALPKGRGQMARHLSS